MKARLALVALGATVGALACSGGGEGGAVVEELRVETYDSDTNGAIQVMSTSSSPVDFFRVLQGETQVNIGNPPLLNGTVELPPGTYEVDVNLTRRSVTLEAGRKVILSTGDLLVEGEPESAFWYPMQNGERKLVSNPPLLNRFRSLFAGSYDVFVYEGVGVPVDSLGVAEVRPGRTTVVNR